MKQHIIYEGGRAIRCINLQQQPVHILLKALPLTVCVRTYLWRTDVQFYSSVAHGMRELPIRWVHGEEEPVMHWVDNTKTMQLALKEYIIQHVGQLNHGWIL